MKRFLLLLALALAGCDRSVVETPIDVPALVVVQTAAPATQSTDIVGRVVGVHDGDTITVYRPGLPEAKIRLSEIDAPELGQPFGQDAKQMLSRMVFGVEVRVEVEDIDRYGRSVGRVYFFNQDINADMVRQGGAWVYDDYSNNSAFEAHEANARDARLGLWAPEFDQGRVEPWNWRRGRRGAANDNAPVAPSQAAPERSLRAEAGSCSKTRCSQMTTCAEAIHHLEVCRVSTLDGDRDGTPCEALC